MLAREARMIARRWVREEGSAIPGFRGAFFHGSIGWLADDATIAPSSDVDIMVVLVAPDPPVKPGKFVYGGVLLEVSYIPADQLRSPELVLGLSHLAGSFRTASIIADPSGQLVLLQAAVARDYARRYWVQRRCEHARDKVLQNLRWSDEATLFHDQVISWLFGTSVTTHMLLVAGLRNPTVRTRYLATRALLADYGHLDFYESLMEQLGCAHLSRERATHHLNALTEAFDYTKGMITTPFFFASDLSEQSRPIAIDGSREMIERGDYREALFWIAVTYARCQKALHYDAPEALRDRFADGYLHLLGDLGIATLADRQRRGQQVEQSLPHVWEVAEAIMAANREIVE